LEAEKKSGFQTGIELYLEDKENVDDLQENALEKFERKKREKIEK